jgi:hypothetical protein
MRKMSLLGVKDLYSLVDFFFEYPQSSPDLLGARMRFPRVDVGEELHGVRIRLSPAALLLPFDRYREAAERAALYLALIKNDERYAEKEVKKAYRTLQKALKAKDTLKALEKLKTALKALGIEAETRRRC